MVPWLRSKEHEPHVDRPLNYISSESENDMAPWIRAKVRKLNDALPKYISSESEDDMTHLRRAHNYNRIENRWSEIDAVNRRRRLRKEFSKIKSIFESIIDGMPSGEKSYSLGESNHGEPFEPKLSDFYDDPERILKMMNPKTFAMIFKEKIHMLSDTQQPGAKEIAEDNITRMFETLGSLKISDYYFESLWKHISSDERTFEPFVIKITKILTDRWGYISMLQNSNVKEFLLSHPDLVKFHRMLKFCDENQWKEIEHRLLEAHLEERPKDDVVYKDA
ncbi:hypothetical protein BY996DRAFT_7353717, partial [Phakopsora pachyrhizi]